MKLTTKKLPDSLQKSPKDLASLTELTRLLVAGRKRLEALATESEDILLSALSSDQLERVRTEIPEAMKDIQAREKDLKIKVLQLVSEHLGLNGGSWAAMGINFNVPKTTIEFSIPDEHLDDVNVAETLSVIEIDGHNVLENRLVANMDVFQEAVNRGVVWDGDPDERPPHALLLLSDLVNSGIVKAGAKNRSVTIRESKK